MYTAFPLPDFLNSINQWYTENFNDPFFVNTPNLFRGLAYIELLFHLPFFFYVSIGLWKGKTINEVKSKFN